MKKIISGTIAGALSIVVLTWTIVVLAWASDAMGRIGHEDADVLDGVAELAAAGSSGEFDDILAVDLADDDADDVRTRLSRRGMSGLELTDEQEDKIETLRSAYTREMIQLRADSRLARVDLRELMNEISPDIDRVKELAAAASAAQGAVFERSALYRAEFKHVLTPEQQENLRESFR
ncbi:MAG: periplasmic heavy metal sensor, partial [Gemmatimonadetes bacterium]|nr:periplasmic heavy metal sensor [Gemmatimonadota bacterium]